MRRSEDRVRGFLKAADVDASCWGSPGTKTIADCADETEVETWMYLRCASDGSGRKEVVRFARRSLVYARYFDPERERWMRLRESSRVHRGGYKIDERDLCPGPKELRFPSASYSETCLLGEHPMRTGQRGAKEEPKFFRPPLKRFKLLTIFPVHEHFSEAYPGIITANRDYAIEFLARKEDYARGKVRIERAKGIHTIFNWCEEDSDFKEYFPLAA